MEPETEESRLLPSQLVEPKLDAFLPEKRLMVAVLAVALMDQQKYAATTDVWGRRRFAKVEHWFMSDDTRWPFSFVNICETVGLDTPSIRAGVRACQRRPLIASTGPG